METLYLLHRFSMEKLYLFRKTSIEIVILRPRLYMNAYHLLRNFILKPNFWSKKITSTAWVRKFLCGFGKFAYAKNCNRILISNVCICQTFESNINHKSTFFNNGPWLISHDHNYFFKNLKGHEVWIFDEDHDEFQTI